jgi:MFS family permease
MKSIPATVLGYFLGGAMIGSFVAFWAVSFLGLHNWGILPFVVGAAGGGALAAVLGFRQARREQQYHEELTGLAAVTGFRHTPHIERKELGPLLRVPILKSCSMVQHRLVRLDDTLPLEMLDVCHLEGHGKHRHSVWRTLVLLPGGAVGLPDFSLRSLDKTRRPLFGLLRPGGILFDSPSREEDAAAATEFARHYLLAPLNYPHGETEERDLVERIRQVFSLEVLRHFAEDPGWEVQASDGHLVLWHGKKPCPAADRPTLLVDALRIQEALTHDPAGGRTLVPGDYRRDMFRIAATVGGVAGGAIVGFFLGGLLGLVFLIALPVPMGNAPPGWLVALSWLIFVSCPVAFTLLGGYVGYRLHCWRGTQEGKKLAGPSANRTPKEDPDLHERSSRPYRHRHRL